MANQNPNVYARASIAVVAIFTIAWSWPAFGQGNVPFARDLAKGSPYHVFLSQNPRKEQQEAVIAVVQTRTGSDAAYGLVFLQTRETNQIGLGMVCERAKVGEGSALECDQTVGGRTEILRVAAIGSEFCNSLRDQIETCVTNDPSKKKDLYTTDLKNPIAIPNDCKDEEHPNRKCVCYEIDHGGDVCSLGHDFPPNSGTGTGGHD